ncbi:hypothetical protein IU449_27560 [Nocardia higoensis]|uniref:Uncharacterized protein n=1 Tax=Nocardia higoensis TaxID=228599 RepID=A0ABS0DMI6_9NOCA|nr:hypothetical protein [Nocardia higoensis]MBF6358259.1 hypothetical protein [Nocardia higoensis]
MNQTLRKALLVTIAALLGIIIGITAALLTHFGGGHVTEAIRDGGIGFAAATGFVLLILTHLDLL